MTTLTESIHPDEHLVSEANGERSREAIIVGSGADLVSGTVLGVTETSAATVTPGTPVSGSNQTVGNGAVGTWTADAGAPAGIWQLVITNEAANGGAFKVVRPDGTIDGYGVVASAYNGLINGTLADGANDWKEDDVIPIVVSYSTPALKYKQFDPSAVNGLQYAAAVLRNHAKAASADVSSVARVRDCELNADIVTWPVGITAANKAAAISQLKALGIILR